MTRYRGKLYGRYQAAHSPARYGPGGIAWVERQFPVWDCLYSRFLPRDKSARILDAGCGAGGFLHFLHCRGYRNAEGVDISDEQVGIAKRLGIEGVTRAEIRDHLLHRPIAYDCIFIRDLIEHFTKDEALEFLSAALGALKPCGTLVVQTPNASSLMAGKLCFGDLSHETPFTPTSLAQAMFLAGFWHPNFYPVEPPRSAIRFLGRWLAWRGIAFLLRGYLFVETGSGRGILTQNFIAVAHKPATNSVDEKENHHQCRQI